jgi:hypothetical protein
MTAIARASLPSIEYDLDILPPTSLAGSAKPPVHVS